MRLNVLFSKATRHMGIGPTPKLPFQLHDLFQGLGSECGDSFGYRFYDFNTCTSGSCSGGAHSSTATSMCVADDATCPLTLGTRFIRHAALSQFCSGPSRCKPCPPGKRDHRALPVCLGGPPEVTLTVADEGVASGPSSVAASRP